MKANKVAARPEVQGDAMRLRNGGWYWRRGPLEVELTESVDFDHNGRKDWCVRVAVFEQLVAEDWKRTEAEAAKWADRKLAQIERALLEPKRHRTPRADQ